MSIIQMNYDNYCKDMFESIPDYGNIVLLLFLLQNDKKLLGEIGFSEHDFIRLNLKCKHILIEHHEEYLDYVKNEQESVIERYLNN